LINCNQNLDAYARFGYPLVSDSIAGYAGPLAGLQAGLNETTTPLLATCPCDSPFLPADLVARLHAGLRESGARLAVARAGVQVHPVFLLCRRELLGSLTRYLQEGGRKIDAWYASIDAVEVGFDDEADAFVNINTIAQMRELDGWEEPA
jgi:molybdopterin-guanine dinucleotide biosynthesis protein A